MIIQTQQILLCIASCTHLAMLCDLQAMKPVEERDLENFDPNDEVLLRCFVIPALLDGLRVGRFDTDTGAKTDIILVWALGMHLDDEADKLTAEVFAGLTAIFSTMSQEHIDGWWRCVSEEYRDENRPMLQQRERSLLSAVSRWRLSRCGTGAD